MQLKAAATLALDSRVFHHFEEHQNESPRKLSPPDLRLARFSPSRARQFLKAALV
jgi:hypothetical protein